MSRNQSHINSAVTILSRYKGEEPFASFLKKYFAADKKYGSKDRKQIAHLCYCFFRLGKSLPNIPVEEKLLIGLFLCSTSSNEILDQLKPEWNASIQLPVQEKCSMLNVQFSMTNVFPWKEELSEGIEHERFCESFFVQPDLFLRIRPGCETIVKTKLNSANIAFTEISTTCLSLANATKIETVIELDKVAVVQDLNSQKTGAFLPVKKGREDPLWDCCAGSGGKSILAFDMNPKISLTVSDTRESILANLKKRFEKAGIKNYKTVVVDLAHENIPYSMISDQQSIIIADLPCTGSGTWGRTPEQLYFFDEKKINQYASRQKKIISNAMLHLRVGGYLQYITCSVFKKENEEVVEFIQNSLSLRLKSMQYLKGYDKKADTLFVALFSAL